MTDDEYIKTIPSLSAKELIDELNYCGRDPYYDKECKNKDHWKLRR